MINLLDKDTINKIAAGEAVERPASVLKELIENSIDAGADTISTEIRGGGIEMIRITDNGCGIPREDIVKAFLRHATSKLSAAEDLLRLRSMGFRGEALASVAAVSRTELITRPKEELIGSRYRIEGGHEVSFEEIGAPHGTTLFVRDLFYNVPARRKFLRSSASEAAACRQAVQMLALSHPDISFSYKEDKREVFVTNGRGSLRENIYILFGRETAEALIQIRDSFSGTGTGVKQDVTVSGFIGKPTLAKARRDMELFFVNGRTIRSSVLETAVEDAFRPYLMQHRFPVAVLMINVEPSEVDVNVHPQKTEVRFSDPRAIFKGVNECVRAALVKTDLIPDIRPESLPERIQGEQCTQLRDAIQDSLSERIPGNAGTRVQDRNRESLPAEISEKPSSPISGRDFETLTPAAASVAEPCLNKAWKSGMQPEVCGKDSCKPLFTPPHEKTKEEFTSLFQEAGLQNSGPSLRIVGQVFDTYWIMEAGGEMYLVDQHAAHEKVLFERFKKQWTTQEPVSQMLYPPMRVHLTAEEAVLFENNRTEFDKLGYEIEEYGDGDYLIRSVPAVFECVSDTRLLHDLLGSLSYTGSGISSESITEKLASISCKAAVKGSHRMSTMEAEELLREMMKLKEPFHCPHGRPTTIRFQKSDIEKMFKRQ